MVSAVFFQIISCDYWTDYEVFVVLITLLALILVLSKVGHCLWSTSLLLLYRMDTIRNVVFLQIFSVDFTRESIRLARSRSQEPLGRKLGALARVDPSLIQMRQMLLLAKISGLPSLQLITAH